jgi:hypothetical protein
MLLFCGIFLAARKGGHSFFAQIGLHIQRYTLAGIDVNPLPGLATASI